MRKILLLALSMTLTGCLGMPETVKPVDEFNLHNYLGKWYEIARLDHSFEEGLTQVTAEYTLKDDGGVAVVNKGFLADENQWKEAEGKAYFINGDSEGYLKVSFFGPFYGSYVVFALDKTDYQYAFVSGPNTDYLWLLARTPTVDQSLIDTFVSMAKERGFDTERLIFVEQK
ncbi:lipocalin family protein [Vibrio vulnificus]|nr:lipocalin family protein [Vibrio vulnificus]EIA1338445.1 lipocalin family protein [Vibrio vulnificus]EIX4871346.1 lipocalin family protein [Vibrio vulnificus]EIX4872107.1 lipocalin family protein [Vibrio vulnificus]